MNETFYQENIKACSHLADSHCCQRGVLVGVGNIPLIPDTRSCPRARDRELRSEQEMSAPDPRMFRRLSGDKADHNLIIFRDRHGVIAGQTGTLNLNGQWGFTHLTQEPGYVYILWFFAIWNSSDLF